MKRFHVGPILILFLAVALAGCDLLVPPDPPGAPSSLDAEPLSRSEVELTWQAPAADAGGELGRYQLDRAVSGGEFATQTLDAGQTSLTDSGLETETVYTYRLRACNDGGCSDYTPNADVQTFGILEITVSNLTDATVGQPYTTALDADGGGGDYTWALTAGSLPTGLALTDTTGVISGTPTAADTTEFTVQATAGDGQTDTATLTLRVQEAEAITINTYALPPVIVGGTYDVHLSTSGGTSEQVWSVAEGTLPDGLALVDTAGVIEGTPTTPDTAALTLRVVSAGDSADRAFELMVVPHDTTTFNVTPLNVSGVPDSIQTHVDSAVVWWERVLTGNVEAGFVPAGTFAASDCAGFGEAVNGTTIDDVIVLVNIESIDGPGGILGQAGPCAVRNEPWIPGFGILTLDQDDLAPLTGTETLTELIFHEIGHVLGYGTVLWGNDFHALRRHAGTDSAAFAGAAAVGEYQDLGGSGNVPLENDGGSGTRDAHWEEDVFNREVMTGFAEQVGTDQPLSRVTVASMEDIGYQADRDQAESFSLSSALMAGARLHRLGRDRVLEMPVVLLESHGMRPPPFR